MARHRTPSRCCTHPAARTTKAGWTWDEFVKTTQELTLDTEGRNSLDPNFDAANVAQYRMLEPPRDAFAAWSADRDPALEAVLAFEERERARAKPSGEAP